MNFASGDYPLFLAAVFLLYTLVRAGRGWGTAARLALMTIFADVVYALVTKDASQVWDPVGGAALKLAVGDQVGWAPWWHYLAGAAVLGGAIVLGVRRADALATPRAQGLIARGFAACLAGLGALVYLLHRADRLDDLTELTGTYGHLVFLVAVGVALGASMGRPRSPLGRVLVLFLASCLFYQAWAITQDGANRYLLALILGIVVLDYHLALWIERSDRPHVRKALLVVSLCSNLGVLALFKYADFFRIDVLHVSTTPWGLILPAGISFHTFQSLSYTIDVYRRQLKATTSVVQFATFVMFFPQLVAGPIVRAEELLPQLADPPAHDADRAADGLYRIGVGLFKKIGVSDLLAVAMVDPVFKHPDHYSSLEALVAVYAYAFQIYLDFSAYSDIAIGSAQLLGFQLPENFRTPYRSANLQEFWRRWHMTLSRWLRDYLYIPLGGSRKGELFTYRNLFLTMLLGGLWHGASWTFIVWGALHGGGLAMTRVFQRKAARDPRAAPGVLIASALVAVAGVAVHVLVFGDVASPWFHLAFAWAYLTPLWAALTAWLSLAEEPPRLTGMPHPRAALGLRLVACWVVLAFGAAVAWGPTGAALAAIGGALAFACAADAVEVWPDRAGAIAWLAWAAKRALAVFLVFQYVCLAWVFFRAKTFGNAYDVLARVGAIFRSGEHDHANVSTGVLIALAVGVAAHLVPNRTAAWLRDSFVRLPPPLQGALLAAAGLAIHQLALARPKINPFIYFQF